MTAVRASAGALLLCLTGCGGGVPLMHSAHPVAEDEVTVGAGFSGTVLPTGLDPEGEPSDVEALSQAALSPGIAPWVGGRLGFGRGFDAGLTYSGRSIRVDGRRSFELDDRFALSAGVGLSGLLPKRQDEVGLRVGGFGADLPVLVGWSSRADVYTIWLGARGGAELLRGQRELPDDPAQPDLIANEDVQGWHAHAGGLLGLRVGFRYLFAVLEVDAAMHWASGEIGGRQVTVRELGVAPAGAIVVRF